MSEKEEILEYELGKAQEVLLRENEAYGRLMDDYSDAMNKLHEYRRWTGWTERRKATEQIISDWDLFRNSEGGNHFTRNEQEDILDKLTEAGNLLVCPIWQCGGSLHPIETNDWQTPLLVCDNCGAIYQFLRFDSKLAKTLLVSQNIIDKS